MIAPSVLLCAVALSTIPLHGGAISTPIPHWAVLLAVVPSLWLLIGVGVVAIDRLLGRLGV